MPKLKVTYTPPHPLPHIFTRCQARGLIQGEGDIRRFGQIAIIYLTLDRLDKYRSRAVVLRLASLHRVNSQHMHVCLGRTQQTPPQVINDLNWTNRKIPNVKVLETKKTTTKLILVGLQSSYIAMSYIAIVSLQQQREVLQWLIP